MAFSGSSYFAGVGTVFAAVGLGFACGMMITNDVVQPPNRLERVSTGATTPSKPDAAPSTTASTIPPQPAAPAVVKTDAATNVQEQSALEARNPPPPSAVTSASTAPAKDQRAGTRSANSNKDASHKRADERKFLGNRRSSERRRRRDQEERQLDEATNVVREMPPESTVGAVVERDDVPRYRMRPRPFGLFGDDETPRVINEPPPRFGFFGE